MKTISAQIRCVLVIAAVLLAMATTAPTKYSETPSVEAGECASFSIVEDGDPILRKACDPVECFDEHLAMLLDGMAKTMRNANGIGIAGNQVGVSLRLCVIDCQDGEGVIELVNPEIIAFSGKQTGEETCLSFPGEQRTITRPLEVTVRAQDRNGNWFELRGEGLKARVLCHEIDHLDGICFVDIAE